MGCALCAAKIEKVLNSREGVIACAVNYSAATVSVDADNTGFVAQHSTKGLIRPFNRRFQRCGTCRKIHETETPHHPGNRFGQGKRMKFISSGLLRAWLEAMTYKTNTLRHCEEALANEAIQ